MMGEFNSFGILPIILNFVGTFKLIGLLGFPSSKGIILKLYLFLSYLKIQWYDSSSNIFLVLFVSIASSNW